MVCKIVWTEKSCADLEAIVRYISRHNRAAARDTGYGIYRRTQILADFPEAGSVVRELEDADLRQLLFGNYRIIHQLDRKQKVIFILRVWHAARGDVEL